MGNGNPKHNSWPKKVTWPNKPLYPSNSRFLAMDNVRPQWGPTLQSSQWTLWPGRTSPMCPIPPTVLIWPLRLLAVSRDEEGTRWVHLWDHSRGQDSIGGVHKEDVQGELLYGFSQVGRKLDQCSRPRWWVCWNIVLNQILVNFFHWGF